ncbi:MAG: sulfur oxidation c-type cytochrome SoxX [Gammaproteobacteria bacterium]
MMSKRWIAAVAIAVTWALGTLLLPAAGALAEEGASAIEQGKALAFDRKKGNCLACHMIATGDLPGNIGPPLVAMSMRYPDKAKLRAQIWDATVANPMSTMPPFGSHRILTEDEIDLVTEFIYAQ